MIELEVYKKSDFYEDYISSQKEYYERENADAYFAERLAKKDNEIAEWKSRYFELQDKAMEIDKELTETKKQLRHNKYKRCLAMARFCHVSSVLCEGPDSLFYRRWFHKWHELAEKFKEGK